MMKTSSAAFLFLVLALPLLLVSGMPTSTTVQSCPPNMRYNPCGTSCPETCASSTTMCNMMCVAGCVCQEGYVRRCDKNDVCVPKSECYIGMCSNKSPCKPCPPGSMCPAVCLPPDY
ncbi:venom serine protease inhibitor isoform X4 [Microcaecilia unicolor]|uniref:Venom serine protease inhibitor-like isoform X4 n=1 Tax=Microcaecilia unicolor TaxID=1415580 RepID=A0A6P7YKS4_9AMPH|nr:venom serine protease inhibitor-like isoform X4 [Microcaecilia unicolor]